MASGLPLVPGPGRRPDRLRQSALLALRALAALQLGELETTGAAQLQEMRGPLLLVAQPEKPRLQRVRGANNAALTTCRKAHEKGESEGISARNGPNQGPRRSRIRPKEANGGQRSAIFTIGASCFAAMVNLEMPATGWRGMLMI
jgi:hypothetical protein